MPFFQPTHADRIVLEAVLQVVTTLHEKTDEKVSMPVRLLVSELLRLHLAARLESTFGEFVLSDPQVVGVDRRDSEAFAVVASNVWDSLSPVVLAACRTASEDEARLPKVASEG
jgi:hypothetical protein